MTETTVKTNFTSDKTISTAIKNVTKFASNAVGVTAGPKGQEVMIQDRYLNHITTKDGYTVLQSLVIEDPMYRTLLNFIKRISKNLNQEVGDGTTSAVCIAAELYNGFSLLIAKNKAHTLTRDIDTAVSMINKKILETFSFRVPTELGEDRSFILRKIAELSANNNQYAEIADFLVEIYSSSEEGFLPNVKIDCDYRIKESFFNFIPGFQYDFGMPYPLFATNQDTGEFRVSGKVKILCFDRPLTGKDATPLVNILEYIFKESCPLVIMAPSFEDTIMEFLMRNKKEIKDNFPVCPVAIATSSKNAKEVLRDFEIFSGCKAINEELSSVVAEKGIDSVIGEVDSAYISDQKSIFINNNNSPEYLEKRGERLSAIRGELDAYIYSGEEMYDTSKFIANLRRRLNNLSYKGLADVHVGGKTPEEIRSKKFLYDDANAAIRSAIEKGYGIAGGYNVIWAIRELLEELPISEETDKLRKVFVAIKNEYLTFVRSMILKTVTSDEAYSNSRDDITAGYYVNLATEEVYNFLPNTTGNDVIGAGVLGPIYTDIRILESAMSIVKLLINTAGFVSTDNMPFDLEL